MIEQLPHFQTELKKMEHDIQCLEILSSPQKLRELTQKYNETKEIVSQLEKLKSVENALEQTAKMMASESNEELKKMASEELENLGKNKKELEKTIREILTPADPLDKKDIIVEIRSGVGGDEAELFAADLFRMYSRYAEKKGWKTTLLDSSPTVIGGLKEVIFEIDGENVYKNLKYESGVHRVQRIPETEKSGRIHTSTATVAVLPKVEEVDIPIKNEDIRIDTFLSSGPGGQGVQTTYSGVRVTHLPTSTIVTCQTTRSQIKNKEKALEILRSRLFAAEEEKRQKELSEKRKKQIGGGMRAEKIRTYNFPQDRITDHRIKESWHNIFNILAGNLDEIISALEKAEKVKG